MKNIAGLCIFLMLLSFFTTSLLAQNVLQNPSFESPDGQGGVEHWTKRPGSWQDSEVVRSGNHSYRLDPGNNHYTHYVIEENSLEIGREYTLAAWTKTKNQNEDAYVYWRYVNFDENGVQFPPFDLNNLEDTTWTYLEWNLYPASTDARLDMFWNSTEGSFWIDDVSLALKERVVEQIHALPEPWRLNIGDEDVCTVFIELQDLEGFRVSNSSDEVSFTSLDPEIITLLSPPSVNAVFGRASAQFIGTNTPGVGRIEIEANGVKDTLRISNREKYVHDDFFHIGTMMFASLNTSTNIELIADLDSFGLNIVFPINGGTAATLSFLEGLQMAQKDIKVIAQTHFINLFEEDFYNDRNWEGAVATAQEYADLFTPFGDLLYGYRLSDEPNGDIDHHRIAFHSNALYAADPARQAVTIDSWAIPLTERNMRIRNNDFKLTYVYFFNHDQPVGIYPWGYGPSDSETAFDSLSRYDNKPWFHMIQSFTMDVDPPVKRWPEVGEMKLHAYAAVSFGAKGIYYFFYHDIPGHPQEIRGLTDGGLPAVHHELWEPARQLNWNLRNNERVFLKGTNNPYSVFAASDNNLIRIADFEPDEPDGKYIMPVNTNSLETTEAWIDILVPDIESVENMFATGGEILEFTDGMLKVKIDPGDAMLINLKSPVTQVQNVAHTSIQIYPNPVSDLLHINHEFEVPVTAEVFDINGRLLFQQNISSRSEVLSTAKLNNGLYFLVLRTPKELTYFNFVKF